MVLVEDPIPDRQDGLPDVIPGVYPVQLALEGADQAFHMDVVLVAAGAGHAGGDAAGAQNALEAPATILAAGVTVEDRGSRIKARASEMASQNWLLC